MGANVKVFGPNNVFLSNNQMQAGIGYDGWASFQFPTNGTKRVYYLNFDINDKNGNTLKRNATLIIG